MANFSVEWLSRSYYEDAAIHTKVHEEMEEFAKRSGNQYSTTSPNNSCGHTSGSESELGDDSEGEATQQRRMRTKFTSEQISNLEKEFSKHKYLGAVQRGKVAEKLNLSETQHPALSGQFPTGNGHYPQLQPLHRTTLPASLHHQHRSHPLTIPPHFC